MSSGPLRQAVGAVGLLGLLPTAWLLVAGALTPVQAAVRAVITLVGVIVVGRIVAWWLHSVARNLERRADTSEDEPRRRRTDGPAAAAGARGSAQGGRPDASSDDTQRAGSSPGGASATGASATGEAVSADAASSTA